MKTLDSNVWQLPKGPNHLTFCWFLAVAALLASSELKADADLSPKEVFDRRNPADFQLAQTVELHRVPSRRRAFEKQHSAISRKDISFAARPGAD
jgi:hypothetical protein